MIGMSSRRLGARPGKVMRLSRRKILAAFVLFSSSICIVRGLNLQPALSQYLDPPQPLTTPDKACSTCHRQIYESYERTSMARGSGLATDGLIEGAFEHRPSGIRYRIYASNGQAWMSYERPGPSAPLAGTRQLSYFIGSAHRGRTYLYRQDGLWFEVPINYYGKKQLWDMAPAYGSTRTMPGALPVDPDCLHCHATQVGIQIDGIRNRIDGRPFSQAGIGCSACHGDPASHLHAESAHTGVGTIVNPAHLKPAERDSTCLQCHLEGDAAIYKPGHSLATFQPGDNLQSSVVYFVDANRPNFGNRASSQYEALLRSACRRASGDRLTCTTCHDPHSSPEPADRVAFYRQKCLSCHNTEAIAVRHHPEQQDCATCHMPTRNTADISHEQLTDHDIQRQSKRDSAPILLSDLGSGPARKPIQLVAVGSTTFTDRELGLAYAQFARQGDQVAGEKAMQLLNKTEASGNADAPVHEQLAFLEQISGSKVAAARQYQATLQLEPHNTTALADLAVLQASSGHVEEAIRLLQQTVDLDSSQTIAGMNLAFIECSTGRSKQARELLQRLSVFNPDNPTLRTFVHSGTYAGGKCNLE